jgi:hypothetical protein
MQAVQITSEAQIRQFGIALKHKRQVEFVDKPSILYEPAEQLVQVTYPIVATLSRYLLGAKHLRQTLNSSQ